MKKYIYIIISLCVVLFLGSSVQSLAAQESNSSAVELNASESKWKDKKIVTFGDSITWYDGENFFPSHKDKGKLVVGYQSYMRKKLQAVVVNQGESGSNMAQILASKIKPYNFADVDAVTITSGANDHRKNIPLGKIGNIRSKFDETTFFGALQSAVETILIDKPTIKIYLITPIKGWYYESGTTNVPDLYKGEKILSEDFINAIKEVGELYSLPVLDLYNLSGINEITKAIYIGDNPDVFTSYELHPNNEGYKRMAELIIPFLENN